MRSYYVDELNPGDMQRLLPHLEAMGLQASMENIYWLQVPDKLLTQEQIAHMDQCGPFVASMETGPNWLKAELLIRSRGKLRCSCITYATPEQREWLITQVDNMLRDLDIPV